MDFQAFYEQLKKGAIQRLYLLEGEEEYGKDSALTALRKAVLSGPMAMLNENILINPSDSELIAACETLPILESRRLVIVRDFQQLTGRGKSNSSSAEEGDEEPSDEPARKSDSLTPYLERLPETVCLVFFVRGKANGTRKLYRRIKELGGIVSFDQLDQERLIRWIAKEFNAYHLQADRQTIEHLIFACGKELMALKGEIAKISSYAEGKNSVTQQDIDAIATLSVEYKVFDLSDKVADSKATQALPLMNEMLRSGEQRLMLLALLQRHYRQLLFTRIMMDERASESAIAAELGLPGFAARRLIQSAQGYSTPQLQAAYTKCIHQEFLVKSGQLAEDGSLEQLVLHLISIKKEGRATRRA